MWMKLCSLFEICECPKCAHCDVLNATDKIKKKSRLCNICKTLWLYWWPFNAVATTTDFCYLIKAYFQGSDPVHHARSNPETALTYTRLITQQIYNCIHCIWGSIHAFRVRLRRILKLLPKPKLSHHHIKTLKYLVDPGISTARWFQGLNTIIWGFDLRVFK